MGVYNSAWESETRVSLQVVISCLTCFLTCQVERSTWTEQLWKYLPQRQAPEDLTFV